MAGGFATRGVDSVSIVHEAFAPLPVLRFLASAYMYLYTHFLSYLVVHFAFSSFILFRFVIIFGHLGYIHRFVFVSRVPYQPALAIPQYPCQLVAGIRPLPGGGLYRF